MKKEDSDLFEKASTLDDFAAIKPVQSEVSQNILLSSLCTQEESKR